MLWPILASACVAGTFEAAREQTLPWLEARLGNHPLRVMVANSLGEQQRGLMFRPSLKEGEGMLFVHDSPRILSFWMKNTLVPLDLLFFSPKGEVTEWIQGLKPDPGIPEDELPSYTSREEAQFALEVASGTIAKWGIRKGDRLTVPGFPGFPGFPP